MYLFGGLRYQDRSTASTKYSTNLDISGLRRIAFKMPCIFLHTTNPPRLLLFFPETSFQANHFSPPVFQTNWSQWLRLERVCIPFEGEKQKNISSCTRCHIRCLHLIKCQTRKCTEFDQNSCVGFEFTSRNTQPNGASINFPNRLFVSGQKILTQELTREINFTFATKFRLI